jgi:hypothetical protein
MNDEQIIHIDELVGILYLYNNDELVKYQKMFPKYYDILKPGIIAGRAKKIDDIDCFTGIGIDALNTIKNECAKKINKIKSKLRLQKNIMLVAQIIIMVSSCSLIGMLTLEYSNSNTISYISAIMALGASILTLYAQNSLAAIGPYNRNIFNIYEELVKYYIEAEETVKEIEILKKNRNNENKISNLVKKGNEISHNVKKILLEI